MTNNNEKIYPNYLPEIGGIGRCDERGDETVLIQYEDGEKSCRLEDLFYDESDFYLLKTDETIKFHVGQSYTKNSAKALACSICGGNEFNVGQDEYFTAIRCVNCLWEMCIHDG